MGSYEQMEILKLQREVHDIKQKMGIPIVTKPTTTAVGAYTPPVKIPHTPAHKTENTAECKWCSKKTKLITGIRVEGRFSEAVQCDLPICPDCFNAVKRRILVSTE